MSLKRSTKWFIVTTAIFFGVVIALFLLNFPTRRWITGRSRTRITQFTALNNFVLEPDFTKMITQLVFVDCSLIIKEGKVLDEIKAKKLELPILIMPRIIKGQHQNIKILDLSKEQNPPSLNFSTENTPNIELSWEEGNISNLFKLSIKLLRLKTEGSLSLHGSNIRRIDIPTNSKVFESATNQIKRYKEGKEIVDKSKKLSSGIHYLEGDTEIKFYSGKNGEIKIDFISPLKIENGTDQTTPLIRKISPPQISPPAKPTESFRGIAFKSSGDALIDLGGHQGEKEYKAGQDIVIHSNNFHTEVFIDSEGMQLSFAGESKDVRANKVQQIQGTITDFSKRHGFWMVVSVLAALYFSVWSIITSLPSPPSQKKTSASGSNDKPSSNSCK